MVGRIVGHAPRHVAFAIVLLALAGCTQQQTQVASAAKVPGKHTVEPATGWSHPEEEDEMDAFVAPFNPLTGAGEADQVKAQFRGNDRKDAKTSIADAPIEHFASLEALKQTLQSDDAMRHHDPKITEDADSGRVKEEKRNVRVPAFICAIKYEADSDWHVIGSSDENCDGPTFFTFEVSGVPKSSAPAHDRLLQVRKDFADILDHDLPGPNTYSKYKDGPIPVVVQGSLFYDVDHAPGVVGPGDMKPTTAWEVHPVTKITRQ